MRSFLTSFWVLVKFFGVCLRGFYRLEDEWDDTDGPGRTVAREGREFISVTDCG